MFPFLEHRDPGDAALQALAKFALGRSRMNVGVPAGFTYLGQFIDHDITFDLSSDLQRRNDPHARVNFRTPRMDLDSLYGSGPADQPFLYDWDTPHHPGVRLLVDRNDGSDLAPVDLPRNRRGRALIGDPRNDENRILSQLHLLFIRVHNRVVEHILGEEPDIATDELFQRAQRLVRWHYQWIVAHDFLERIVGETLAHSVLNRAPSGWRGQPSIPVEFSGAAYRFGHSMVRKAYRLNGCQVAEIFPVPGGSTADLTGFQPLPRTHIIDWDLFFYEKFDSSLEHNASMRIDPVLATPLGQLPKGVTEHGPSLPLLNLRRGHRLRLPAGADVADVLGVDRLDPVEFLPDSFAQSAPAGALELLRDATPLWYYVLAEADHRGCGGIRLGPVGGQIVAEVLVGLLEADPQSYLHRDRCWKPELPCTNENFTMLDLLAFVGDDDDPCGTRR
jgi:hypothetical protein